MSRPADAPCGPPDPLDARLRAGSLGNGPVRAVAHWLADVHAGAPPAPPPAADGVDERRSARVRRLERALSGRARRALAEVASAQRAFLDRHGERLRARERAGRVRALGLSPPRLEDLRVDDAGAVTAVSGVRDPCDEEPGGPRDGCADAAGLALELACGGRGDLAERLLSAYAGRAHDFALYGVADFHERERALALAESALRRGGPGAADAARRLLLAALATRRRPLLPPVVVAVGGLVACGKSTVSRALAERLGAPRVEADRVRDALLASGPDGPADVHEEAWERAFAPGFGERVYAELLRCAEPVVASGRPVVLDACFPRAEQRRRVRELARRARVPFRFVECRAGEDALAARLAGREAERSGWRELARRLAGSWEPAETLPRDERLVVRTDRPLEATLAELEARLPTWPAGLAE